MGPPIKLIKNIENFKKKWINHPATIAPPFEKNNRIYVTIKRKYRHLDTFIDQELQHLSLGKHLDKTIQNGFTLLHYPELITQDLASFWTRYLDGKKPWER
jgi:tRNA nucleotidyltransferase (CCA-adding enzyme)